MAVVVITGVAGVILSIHVTVAVFDQVFPARSWKVKIKDPVFVNVYDVWFVAVSVSLNQVRRAITFQLVNNPEDGVYKILAVGVILSTTTELAFVVVVLSLIHI